ncbi:MAG TPA: hypothetical protein PLF81_14405 [Candidatus Anammoximicrobium sp.]|nr:hypothetical protein [Candidatus Anammoximicrobium sp.]
MWHGKEKKGYLVRVLRYRESLWFEGVPMERFSLTLVNCHRGRLGLLLDSPRFGLASVGISYGREGVRLDVSQRPDWRRQTIEHDAPALRLQNAEGDCLCLRILKAVDDTVTAEFDVPRVGTARVAFTLGHDRARLAILAPAIRIFPSGNDAIGLSA